MDLINLALHCAPNIHPTTLAAVIRHESALNPYAIGINSKKVVLTRQPANKREAIELAIFLKKQNINFDSGLGQINIRNLSWLNLTHADLFDPCKNLKASAKVLTDCYARATLRLGEGQRALHAALSCYNTGDFHQGISNGYVKNVLAKANIRVPSIISSPEKNLKPEKHLPSKNFKTFEKKDAFQEKSKLDAFQANRKSV